MRFMSFQWRAFSQDDLENSLKRQGIELDTFSYQFDGIQKDDYLYRNFKSVLQKNSYDAVISWNFWPVVAQVCHDLNVSYIAWVYDCPISYEIMPWAGYDTSYIFHFDRNETKLYRNKGVKNIFYHPLGVDVKRIDNIVLSQEDEIEYSHDVSFLGTMYGSRYEQICSIMTELERDYIEEQINEQLKTYKKFILDELVSDEIVESMRQRWKELGQVTAPSVEVFRFWLIQIIGKECTKRDRISLLNSIGAKYDTVYYNYIKHEDIVNAKYHKPLEYNEEMFKMFRATKINLNADYRLMTSAVQVRALNIMAAGGFLLANYQKEFVELFEPGVDFVCFDNAEEAIELADYYMRHEDERLKIAKNGHEAVKKLDYDVQIKKLLDQYLQSSSLR